LESRKCLPASLQMSTMTVCQLNLLASSSQDWISFLSALAWFRLVPRLRLPDLRRKRRATETERRRALFGKGECNCNSPRSSSAQQSSSSTLGAISTRLSRPSPRTIQKSLLSSESPESSSFSSGLHLDRHFFQIKALLAARDCTAQRQFSAVGRFFVIGFASPLDGRACVGRDSRRRARLRRLIKTQGLEQEYFFWLSTRPDWLCHSC